MNASTIIIAKKVGKEVLKVAVKVGLPLLSSYIAGKELDEKVAKAVDAAMKNKAKES